VDTGANVFRYFPEAERLQVSLPDWCGKDGEQKHGKTLAVDLGALYELMETDKTVDPFLREVFHIGQKEGSDGE
jgi:hypothetical protein